MKCQKSLYRTVALFVLFSVASFPCYAEDICSREGKSKMIAAKVTEAQIATICPPATEEQQNKELKLAITPIGLYLEPAYTRGGTVYVDITVKNNSGKFINSMYIEVLAYNDELRVGMTNKNFSSINVGETMVIRQPVLTDGRPWNRWSYTYKIH